MDHKFAVITTTFVHSKIKENKEGRMAFTYLRVSKILSDGFYTDRQTGKQQPPAKPHPWSHTPGSPPEAPSSRDDRAAAHVTLPLPRPCTTSVEWSSMPWGELRRPWRRIRRRRQPSAAWSCLSVPSGRTGRDPRAWCTWTQPAWRLPWRPWPPIRRRTGSECAYCGWENWESEVS